MAFIDGHSPELLKARVNGKPGFLLFPQSEEEDEIHFTSKEALVRWTTELLALVENADHAQPFDEWLEFTS